MTRHSLSRLVAALCLTGAASCASSSAASSSSAGPAAAEDRLRPPRMVSRIQPPSLRVPPVPVSGRSPLRVTLEVLIDADGNPDMRTFRVQGPGAAENREALANWIRTATFEPATEGGRPVPGTFTTSIRLVLR